MNLSLLIILPFLTAVAVLFCRGLKQVRIVALAGSVAQLLLSAYLLFAYCSERAAGNHSVMVFENNTAWFTGLSIHYHVGVDGISIAMILLTAFVVVAGILVSWMMEKLSKEFFFLLLFLSLGAYGFLFPSTCLRCSSF